jgi:protein-S-isoprenylcysteine O-methyltransferase Ste14
MKRVAFFTYGVANHLLFLATYAWLAGFVGNLLVPKSIDSGRAGSIGWAILVDLGLVALFAVQHSVMARPAFKEVWTRIVPKPIERSTYVLFSNVVLWILMWQWRPIDLVIWDVPTGLGRGVMLALFAAGWLVVPAVTLLINHFDLFGTRQVWLHLKRREYTSLPFRTPLAYRWVRHPLYIGWALAFWATPTMTLGHLLFAGSLTVYMAAATIFEERDLVSHFGRVYEEYRQRVPRFVPRLRRADEPATVSEGSSRTISA